MTTPQRVYQHPGMPFQRYLANPHRPEGATLEGMLGDCFRTAFAGALGRPRDSVPHFVSMSSDRTRPVWWWELQRWAQEEYGASVYCCAPQQWRKHVAREDPESYYPGRREFVVVSGPSPRGAFWHAVVADRDLNVVHDPHPLGPGLTSIELAYMFRTETYTPPPRRALMPAAR